MICLMNQICSVLSPGVATGGTADGWGVVPTTAVSTGYRCRFVPAGTAVKVDGGGYRVLTNPSLYLPKFASVAVGYKITYSGTTYKVKDIQQGADSAGRTTHYLCELEVVK